MKIVTIAVKEPRKPWEIRNVSDELETYQKIVGGYIECFWNKERLSFFCNEDGKFLDLKFNFRFGVHDFIMGSVFAARVDTEGDFIDLTNDDIKFIDELNKGGFDNALG